MKGENLSDSLDDLIISNNKVIFWDESTLLGRVPFPQGGIWGGIGHSLKGEIVVFTEELLYLVEYYKYKVFKAENAPPIEGKNILMLQLGNNGFFSYEVTNFKRFQLFRYLKKLGYILLRPECPYVSSKRMFSDGRGEFKLFKPNATFKKSRPEGEISNLIEVCSFDKVLDILSKVSGEKTTLCYSDTVDHFHFLEVECFVPTPGNAVKDQSIIVKEAQNRKEQLKSPLAI